MYKAKILKELSHSAISMSERSDLPLSVAVRFVASRHIEYSLYGEEVLFSNEYYRKVGGKIASIEKNYPLRANIKTHKQASAGEHKLKKVPTLSYGKEFIFKDENLAQFQEVRIDLSLMKKAVNEERFPYADFEMVQKVMNTNPPKDDIFHLVHAQTSVGAVNGWGGVVRPKDENLIKPSDYAFEGINLPLDFLVNVETGEALENKDITVSFHDGVNMNMKIDELEKLVNDEVKKEVSAS